MKPRTYPPERTPLYATISADGGVWTMHFKPHGSTAASSRQGYGPDVFAPFRGSGVPCVDFQPMDFAGYNFPGILEERSCFNAGYTPLATWLQDVQRRGALVNYL